MRHDLAKRLTKVAKVLALLKKFALTEGEFIDRSSKRSLDVMKRSLGKIEDALSRIVAESPKRDQVITLLEGVVSPAGVVDQSLVKSSPKPQTILRAVHEVAPSLVPSVARLISSAIAASHLQNADLVEMAKADPRYKAQFFKAQEKLGELLGIMDQLLSKISYPPQPEEAKENKAPTDSTALEGIESQLRSIEIDMRKNVQTLTKIITERVETLFPSDMDLHDAIRQNLHAAMPSKKVNKELNKSKSFYQDILHLQRGASYDLGEFLSTKNKKLVYQAYKSLIMSMRALGVVQWAGYHPDIILQNGKARELVIKAQKILKKRSELVISRLKKVHPEDDEKDEEKNSPEGTFSDVFETAA